MKIAEPRPSLALDEIDPSARRMQYESTDLLCAQSAFR